MSFTRADRRTSENWVWSVDTLDWVQMTQPGSVAGGGDASAANQVTGNASLSSIDTKLTSQATSARQDTGNTSLASIDGKITAVNTGAVTISAALPPGTNVIGHVIVDTAPSTAVTGPLTDTQLRASAVPVSLASAPSTPVTNANLDVALSTLATASAQSTANTTLAEIALDTDSLIVAQNTAGTSTVGPMVQALVNDIIVSYTNNTIQPLQLTGEGRLRVATMSESYSFTLWGSPISWGDDGEQDDNYQFSAW